MGLTIQSINYQENKILALELLKKFPATLNILKNIDFEDPDFIKAINEYVPIKYTSRLLDPNFKEKIRIMCMKYNNYSLYNHDTDSEEDIDELRRLIVHTIIDGSLIFSDKEMSEIMNFLAHNFTAQIIVTQHLLNSDILPSKAIIKAYNISKESNITLNRDIFDTGFRQDALLTAILSTIQNDDMYFRRNVDEEDYEFILTVLETNGGLAQYATSSTDALLNRFLYAFRINVSKSLIGLEDIVSLSEVLFNSKYPNGFKLLLSQIQNENDDDNDGW